MDRSPTVSDDVLQTKAAELMGFPVEVIASLFATHEPAELARLMDRSFGPEYDDIALKSLVTLANSFAHALENHRRRRRLKPIKLRCTECQQQQRAREQRR